MGKTKVLIVDDHPIFRKGLVQLINEEADMEVCGEAENLVQSMEHVRRMKFDFIIVDITLRNESGFELIKYLSDRGISTPVLVLSMHDEKVYAERALKAGAKGYIMKNEISGKIPSAIRAIIAGKIFISEQINERILNSFLSKPDERTQEDDSFNPGSVLSDRELEIFRLTGKGLKRKEISDALNLNVSTIGTYRERIKEKLNIETSSELMASAIKWVQQNEENEIMKS